ncbi:hypothetical protein SFB1_263G4 [Candidatus Arthromitus sp. SFB-1]|nr:hypothetical protein SFB1_263G4 [Candidatus Arthromitus sp. SFB-1]
MNFLRVSASSINTKVCDISHNVSNIKKMHK